MQRSVVLAAFAMLGILAIFAPGASTRQAAPAASPVAQERARLLELQRAAVGKLRQAGRSTATDDEIRRALRDASRDLEALGAESDRRDTTGSAPAALLPAPLRADLRRAATELTAVASGDMQGVAAATARILVLLEKVRSQIEGEVALGLTFEGSYSQTKPKEPAYGGHASAMGPAPASMTTPEDAAPVMVSFEERAPLPSRMFCGGPTKDHILESACGGVALFDYDGDGRLDIYLVTAAELTPARARIPHRNVLYRNLGGWKFQDVSKQARVDLAAWGSGACVGDVDGDGRLDLYVTNWGSNVLFRNRGDGTFEDITASAGVAAGGWSTGCTFFDADGDGDLDLYVARYVETTWDALVHATRTLVWRNGPHIMGGPAGLPGESDLFFENVGNGRFVEATDGHGLTDRAKAYGLGVVATDYDDDG